LLRLSKHRPSYMQVVEEIANIVKDGQTLFFVGSGISNDPPSRLPTGDELKTWLVEAFSQAEPQKVGVNLLEASRKLGLEEVCQIIYDRLGDELLEKMSTVLADDRVPANKIHRFLAKALERGNVIATTNYDSLIEKACREKIERLYIEDAEFDSLLKDSIGKQEFWFSGYIFKLHGSFRDVWSPDRKTIGSVVTILSRVGKLHPAKKELLRLPFQEYNVVFLGYSAKDVDIYPELIAEETVLPRKVFWIRHSEREIHLLAKEGLLHERRGQERRGELKRDWETFNSDTILVKAAEPHGRDGAIKMICPTREFIVDLADRLNEQENSSFWSLAEDGSHGIGDSREQAAKSKSLLMEWARCVDECTRHSMLAELAIATRQWSLAIELLNRAKGEAKPDLAPDIERRLGWSHYQRSQKDDAAKSKELYNSCLRGYEKRGDRFNEARICSSLGLLFNRRMNDLDAALSHSHKAWEIFKSQFPNYPPEIDGNEPKIDEVVDKAQALAEWALKLAVGKCTYERNLLDSLSAAWHNIGHVHLRQSKDPASVIQTLGYRKAISAPLGAAEVCLLYKALGFTMASKKLMDEIGDVRGMIQADHIIGLTYTRLGRAEEAILLHEKCCHKAALLGWSHEYAQACRNLGVAFAYRNERRKAAVYLWKAIMAWGGLRGGEGRWQDIKSAVAVLVRIYL